MAVPDPLSKALAALDIEPRFHGLLAELCGGENDYLSDVQPEDLQGRLDANGTNIAVPVARGLVRKLSKVPAAALPSSTPAAAAHTGADGGRSGEDCSQQLPDMAAAPGSTCDVSLWCGNGDEASLIRCAVKARLQLGAGHVRRKALTAILDRSGSMTKHWPLLVDALMQVITDGLLQDPFVSVSIIVYDGSATKVPLAGSASELRTKLLNTFAPNRGITCFRAAFKEAELSIKLAVGDHLKAGARPQDVDIATFLFTDGQDTSLPPHGLPSEASARAAREAGDFFREVVRQLGCAAFTCIAAFGDQHSPEMCQYLSDRYTYINRREVLSEWLACGLDEMLGSSGQCVLRVSPPPNCVLAEPVPGSLPLSKAGELEHIIWLRLTGDRSGILDVNVDISGAVPVSTEVDLSIASTFEVDSFEEHLFKLDGATLQLRILAQDLCGKRPSLSEIDLIRARLVDVRTKVEQTKEAASRPDGALRGRAALRARASEVDTLRDRLSYAVGHFDARDLDVRNMGAVAIDAVLRDAGQAKPPGPAMAHLLDLALKSAALPPSEALSAHGHRFTLDERSGCDARELAEQGDALFFQLHDVALGPDGVIISATDSVSVVGHEAFLALSNDGTKPVCSPGKASFSHVGFPLYCTPGHFLRAQLLLPDMLRRLSSGPCAKHTCTERVLLALLGRSVAQAHLARGARGAASRLEFAEAFVHKARAVHAVLLATPPPDGSGCSSLLGDVDAEASHFLAEEESRRSTIDLYAIAAVPCVAGGWTCGRATELAKAIAAESCRRTIAKALHDASEEERLWLAWAVLGPAEENGGLACLDESLPSSRIAMNTPTLRGDGYDPRTAADELDRLDRIDASSVGPTEAGAQAVRLLLAQKVGEGAPQWMECAALLDLIPAWSRSVEGEGSLEALWRKVDTTMSSDGVGCENEAWLCSLVAGLISNQFPTTIRCAIGDVPAIMKVIAYECIPQDLRQDAKTSSVRAAVASATRAFVSRRTAFAQQHRIRSTKVPNVPSPSPARFCEIWGKPAAPADKELHAKARRKVFAEMSKHRLTEKEALADKEYRAMGGSFAFLGRLDTFVEGLHRRTYDLHAAWHREGRSSGPEARDAAVEEMLLRLRWDDNNAQARAKLSSIIACIWDGCEGQEAVGSSLPSSALWLVDEEEEPDKSHSAGASPGASAVEEDGGWIQVKASPGLQ